MTVHYKEFMRTSMVCIEGTIYTYKARVIPRRITMIKGGMQWSNWPLVGELAKVDKTRM